MANAFDFGAVGDGVSDETAALRHALEAGDGVLELGKGTYRITQPLDVAPGTANVQGNMEVSR